MKKKLKTEKDFEKWIQEHVDLYVPFLGLQLYSVKIEKSEKERYLALSCNYPYLNNTIYYSANAFKDWEKGDLSKHTILHELCHIITDPFYVKAVERHTGELEMKDEREKLTDTIASIIGKLILK